MTDTKCDACQKDITGSVYGLQSLEIEDDWIDIDSGDGIAMFIHPDCYTKALIGFDKMGFRKEINNA